MKHIFTVHSPITFFCAQSVILFEKLQKEDVIFYYADYKPVSDLGQVVPSFQEKNKSLWKKVQTFNLVKATDSYLNEICGGDEITAYIDLVHYHQKILITHENCRAFHFIEEGTASYIAADDLPELTRIEKETFRIRNTTEIFRNVFRLLRGFNLKILALPYFANAFMHFSQMKFYTFSEFCYPGVPFNQKIILDPKSMVFRGNTLEVAAGVSGKIILIEESFFRVFKISEEESERVHYESLLVIANRYPGREIVVKLRPNQSKLNSYWIKALKQQGITYELNDSNLPLEEQLIKANNCLLFGTVSSLLFYGSIYGHESYSNYPKLSVLPRSSFAGADYYWENVKELGL